jgi:hypothetical protein
MLSPKEGRELGREFKRKILSGEMDNISTSQPVNKRTAASRAAQEKRSLEKQQNERIAKEILNPVNLFGLREQAAKDKAQKEAQARNYIDSSNFNPISRMDAGSPPASSVSNSVPNMLQRNNDPVANLLQQNQAFGRNLTPKTEYERRIQERELDGNPDWVNAVPNAIDWAFYGNPVGRTITRSLPSDDNMVIRESTGNKALDKTTDIIRSLMSVAQPTGAPIGSGPLVAPYKAADALIQGTRVGSAVERGLANGLGKVMNPNTTNAVASGVVREGLAGGLQSPALDLQMNPERTNSELAESALLGSAFGAGLGGAVPAVASGIKRLIKGGGNAVDKGIGQVARNTELPSNAVVERPTSTISNQTDNALIAPAQPELPAFDPNAQPILRPGQFQEQTGIGIMPNSKIKPYDSLSTDTRSQLTTRQVKEPKSLTNWLNKMYTALFDDLNPLNQQDKMLEQIMGKELPASQRTHTLALGSRGADVISKRIITDGLVDANGNVVGESLKDILKGLPKQQGTKYKNIYVDFEDYLLNKHAITRAERGEKVFRDSLNWTPEYGSQKVAEYEAMFPEFRDTADKLYEFNRNMVQTWMVDEGIITPQQAQAMFDANPYYVPNKRSFTELEKGSRGITKSKQGFGGQSVPIKGYSKGGGQQKIISPIEATIENVDAFVKTAKRNKVMQQYVKNIEANPEAFADWAEIVKQPEKVDDITKMLLDGDGIDEVLDRFASDFDAGFQKTRLDRDNIVRVLVNGEPVHVKIKDQALLNAITALGPEQGVWLLDKVGSLTNVMKNLTTGSNPVFSLTRNLFRDIPQAYIASKTTSNPIKFAGDLIAAAYETLFKKDAYKQYLNIGGGHASPIAANRNLMAQSKGAILPNNNPLKGALPKGYRAYENFLNAVEVAPRLAEFKRTGKMSGDIQKALYAAQDVTTNFKRRGTLTRQFDKVFPYFNAALQGMDQIARVYKDNPVKALTKTALSMSLPAMALYALNYDNPDYQKLSNRTKDAFFNIPLGNGKFLKIAKPQEQGTVFADLPERLMRAFYEEDPDAFRDFADRLKDTLLPPGIKGLVDGKDVISGVLNDTIFGAAVQTVANKSWNGSPIVPGNLERLSPELQSDAKTSTPAIKLGEMLGYSPKKIDYLLKQYTGGLGQLALPLLTPGGDLGSSLASTMVADSTFSNDLSSKFYENKDKLDQAYADREFKKLPDWYSDPLRKRMNKISKSMSSVRKEIRDVQNDTDMSNATKRDRLRELQEKINNYAETGNELANKYMKK